MIKIKEFENKTIITSTVTDFTDSLGYCEHKIPFYLKGVKAPPSLETLQGSASHEEEEKYEEEHFEFESITPEKLEDLTHDLEFAREKIFTRLLVPLKFEKMDVAILLHGRADKILRNKETLVVQDDKFPYNLERYSERIEPYPDQILQALTYLNSLYSNSGGFEPEDWFPIPHKEKMWVIQIRDRNNNNKPFKIFQGKQNPNALAYLHSNIERYTRLILGLEERKHHNMSSKCKPCRYADKCEFRL